MTTSLVGLLVAALLASPPGALPDKRRLAIESLARQDMRVAATGFRLAVANAARCEKQMPATGLILHSAAQYSGNWREAADGLFGKVELVSVQAVVSRSPAAVAGIGQGDSIVAVNGVRLQPHADDAAFPTAVRDRVENGLVSLPATATITVTIGRDGAERQFLVQPVVACRSRFEVVAGSGRFARSDGHLIQIGQRLAEAASDADLAVILAHELAHSILDHRSRMVELEQDRNPKSRTRRSELSAEHERQADRLSIHLLAAAGFDPRSGPAFMRKFGPLYDRAAKGAPHARAEARAIAMEQEIARLGAAP